LARATANKIYRNFTKGLITEASLLTYPENACIRLDNCVLHRKGNISRRLGLDYEPGAFLSSQFVQVLDNFVYKEWVWEAVDNDINRNFLVLQLGTGVFFYDLATEPVSGNKKAFSIEMGLYLAPGKTLADGQVCPMEIAFGKGWMWITGEVYEPILVQYNRAADWITTKQIHVLVRDFDGVDDGLANDEEPVSLSNTHHYNLLNQGWVSPQNAGAGVSQLAWDSFGSPRVRNSGGESPISDFFTSRGRYPGNNKQWWVARDSTTNAFKPDLLDTFFYGAGRAPRGHFVLNAFNKDRTAASGVTGLAVESTNARPSATAFFSGRAWYISESRVYFSQVLDNHAKIGMCHQEADPTSEQASDLIATDGGVITIPEMGRACRAMPAGDGLLIFANNGIWFVSGGPNGFSALDFVVIKVSSIGTLSPNSIVDTKQGILWFDRVGLRSLTVDLSQGGPNFNVTTISEDTIHGFVQDTIPNANKPYIKGLYDPHTNTVQWLYNSEDNGFKYIFNSILHLDMALGAFYLSSFSTDAPRLVGFFNSKNVHELGLPEHRNNAYTYRTAAFVDGTFQFTFAYFRDPTFVDFKSGDPFGDGYDYLSYLESGYELLDDAMRKKEQNYVFVYFKRTETMWVDDLPDKPSSCLFQTKWDWADTQTSGKWTNKVQVYRHTRQPLYDAGDPVFDTGFPMVVTRNKVRGHGKAIQFRFESDGPGKDFNLLGWSVAYSGNTDP
jgi:hypothetical protein